MKSEAAILILMVAQVTQHFMLDGWFERCFGDVASEDHARHEKHGAAVIARPVSVSALKCCVVRDGFVNGRRERIGLQGFWDWEQMAVGGISGYEPVCGLETEQTIG